MINIIPEYPLESWQVRTEVADAACMEQAYWIARAHKENLVPKQDQPAPSLDLDREREDHNHPCSHLNHKEGITP